MTGQPPVLDSRQAADIAARLAELAGTSLPAWRPPAGGDAGTMLQQGFARLMELVLGQLNQVPEKNLLAFLAAMGVSLLPPAPARVPLTLTLAPGSPPTLIAAGTTAAAHARRRPACRHLPDRGRPDRGARQPGRWPGPSIRSATATAT